MKSEQEKHFERLNKEAAERKRREAAEKKAAKRNSGGRERNEGGCGSVDQGHF